MKIIKTTLFLPLIFIFNASYASILLDFGPTAPTGSETNSPAHQEGDVSLSDTTWNVVGTTASMSGSIAGLSYADGSSASGVSFTYGSTLLNSKVVDYTASISSTNSLGSTVNTGIYSGTSVGTDAIFNGSGSTNDYSIGLRIDGLAAGDYSLYVMGRNTNTSADQSFDLFASTGVSSDSYDFGSDTAAASFSTSGSTTDGWVEGSHYGLINISISSGESLFFAMDGIGGQNRAFLSAIQIVSATAAVPEPSEVSVLIGLSIGLGIFFMRKRANRSS